MKWEKHSLRRKLEVSLGEDLKSYRVLGYVVVDENGWRFLKIITFVENITPPIIEILAQYFDLWVDEVDSVTRADLSKSVELRRN